MNRNRNHQCPPRGTIARRLLDVRLLVGERLADTIGRRLPYDVVMAASRVQAAWWRLTGRRAWTGRR